MTFSPKVSGEFKKTASRFVKVGGAFKRIASMYVKPSATWRLVTLQDQQAKLTSSPTFDQYNFGRSIAIEGDRVVVGAHLDESEGFTDGGAAYVYRFFGGNWLQEQKLIPSDLEAGDLFGSAVAISGDTIVVGAPNEDSLTTDGGAVYVFTLSGSTWSQQQKIIITGVGNTNLPSYFFGGAVAIDGDTLAVGAEGDEGSGTNSGAVFTYTRTGGVWGNQQRLTASDAATGGNFGSAVDVQGDRLIIGAEGAGTSGAAYVFERAGGTWSEDDKLTRSGAAPGILSLFGDSVTLDGDYIVVGDYLEAGNGGETSAGAVYVFELSGGTWSQQARLVADPQGDPGRFGRDVALQGRFLVVGAETQGTGGTVFVYLRTGTSWALAGEFESEDVALSDSFGYSVDIDSFKIAVGAYRADLGAQSENGAAYIFQ